MISKFAYNAGAAAAWDLFTKTSAGPLIPRPMLKAPGMAMHNVGGGIGNATGSGLKPVASQSLPGTAAASPRAMAGASPAMPAGNVNPTQVQARPPAPDKTAVTPAPAGTRIVSPPEMDKARAASAAKAPKPAVAPPAAAPPGAPPAAAAPGAPAGGFWQSMKEQAPGAIMNTALMAGIPMAMNAFSSNNQQQG